MQNPTQNMLQHGQAVHNSYHNLIEALEANSEQYSFLLPLYNQFKSELLSPEKLKNYHVFHDCGKHITFYIDESGKKHFPDHAYHSSQQYKQLFPKDTITIELISMDMHFHTKKGEELLELCKHEHAATLYFTAWAEIEANALMFGGIQSENYKIKKSRLLQAGKKLSSEKKTLQKIGLSNK